MTLRPLIILVAAVALTACSKSDDKKSGDDKGAAEEAAGPGDEAPPEPVEPFTGTVDHARLEQAKDGVKPFQKWDVANAHLMATVGEPNESDGNTHYWYVLDGEKCHELSVENANGEVGAVSLGTYDKMLKDDYAKCLAHSDEAGDEAGAEAAGPSGGNGQTAKKKPDDEGGGDDDDDEGGW